MCFVETQKSATNEVPQTHGHSLWLLPPVEIKQRLMPLMEQMRLRHGGPFFEPHITLLGSLLEPVEALVQKVQFLRKLSPLQVKFKRIGHLQSWFRCLFIEIEATAELMDAHERAKTYVGVQRTAPYYPHISLLYGDHSADAKEQLLSTLPPWSSTKFVANTAALVRTEGPPSEWQFVHTIQFL